MFRAVVYVWCIFCNELFVDHDSYFYRFISGAIVKTKPGSIRSILMVALVFSGVSELLIAFITFIFGVAAFLLAQRSYAFLFGFHCHGIKNRWPLSILLII